MKTIYNKDENFLFPIQARFEEFLNTNPTFEEIVSNYDTAKVLNPTFGGFHPVVGVTNTHIKGMFEPIIASNTVVCNHSQRAEEHASDIKKRLLAIIDANKDSLRYVGNRVHWFNGSSSRPIIGLTRNNYSI